jgi:mannan endo-1,4-beta-mannosidase
MKIYHLLALLIGGFLNTLNTVSAQETLRVEGRYLMDPCGEKVVLRGVNEMFIWSSDKDGSKTFPEIAKTGANVVRIVWMDDKDNPAASAANLDKIITNCIANKMIPMPELHGATGEWDKLSKMVDYWVRPDVVEVLKKHQQYLLLNIANEAGGWNVSNKQFKKDYATAIKRIRDTGIKSPLVIDAAGWGQSIDILQANAAYLQKADVLHNILFSVHMWWAAPDNATERIVSEIQESVHMELPLIVGEFAPMGVGCKRGIDYKAIMAQCQQYNIGWLAWSWGLVDNGDCKLMDMTSDEQKGLYEGLEDWGLEVAVTDPNSIQNTSVRTAYINSKGRCKW